MQHNYIELQDHLRSELREKGVDLDGRLFVKGDAAGTPFVASVFIDSMLYRISLAELADISIQNLRPASMIDLLKMRGQLVPSFLR